MSRKAVIGIAVVPVLGILYLGSTWLLGHAAAGRLEAWDKMMESQVPFLKVKERKHQGGLFSSTQEVTYELNKKMFGDIFSKAKAHEAIARPEESGPTFTIRHRIEHGPLPGFNGFGMARMHSELVLSEKTQQMLAKTIGTGNPVKMETSLGFTGGGTAKLESPAFEYTGPEAPVRVSWKGIKSETKFDRNLDKMVLWAAMPGIKVTPTGEGESGELTIGEMRVDSDTNREFKTLHIGKMSFSLADITFTDGKMAAPVKVKDVRYDVDMKKSKEYLDMMVKVGMANLAAEKFKLSDVHYDFSMRHLHGQTFADLSDSMQRLAYSDLEKDPAAMVEISGLFAKYGTTLLEHQPELVFDRIAFAMPEGEAGLSGKVSIQGFKREDFAAGALALLPKIHATVDIYLTEGLLAKDWSALSDSDTSDEALEGEVPPAASAKIEQARAQIAAMEQQGYIKRNGNRLESRIEFVNGALTVNGKPMGGAGL